MYYYGYCGMLWKVWILVFSRKCCLFVPSSQTQAADATCLLCGEGGVAALKWPNAYVDAYGTTCAGVMTNIALSTNCNKELSKYRTKCCTGSSPPAAIAQKAKAAPPSYDVDGPYRACNICYNGNFPGDTSMVINMLDLPGAPNSCTNFYESGRRGYVPNHLCNALQFFAFEPCGCAIGQKAPPIGSGPSPSPPASSPQTRKDPDTVTDGKSGVSLADGRGGGGGGQHHGGRRLKGGQQGRYAKEQA